MATEIENKIILGDCIEVMKTLPDNSVDVACTCYDNKTELLTENGFKLFKNLKKGELVATLNLKTNTLEYQKVQTTQKNKYNGIMYNIKTPSIDLLVTPNHNMVSRRYCRNNTNNLFSLNKIEQIVENKEKVELKKDCIWKGKYKKYQDKSSCITGGGHSGGNHSDMDLFGTPKDRCYQIGEAIGINGHDLLKRVYADYGKSPAVTTITGGNQYGKIAVDDYQWRRLTPIEVERLQTVPDNYTDHVSNSARYKMLGNGWTVDVICHILKNMSI